MAVSMRTDAYLWPAACAVLNGILSLHLYLLADRDVFGAVDIAARGVFEPPEAIVCIVGLFQIDVLPFPRT